VLNAYELAQEILAQDAFVSCVPVINADGDRDVAVIALQAQPLALLTLLHPSRRVRTEALLGVLIKSHELLPAWGYRYANDLRQ
jgi:hypothetical protein